MENSEDEAKIEEKVNIVDDPLLPQKSLFRVDEVASYFDVTDRCIRLWIEHGHLEAKNNWCHSYYKRFYFISS